MKSGPSLVFWTALLCLPFALPTPGKPNVDRIEAALARLITEGIPAHKIVRCPGCPGGRDAKGRALLADAIAQASGRWAISPGLLAVIAYREGAFAGNAKGKLGELSTFQIMPDRAKYADCDLSEHGGAAECAAKLLSIGREKCGSIEGAVVWYATGRTCVADTKHLAWLLWDRVGVAAILDSWIRSPAQPSPSPEP